MRRKLLMGLAAGTLFYGVQAQATVLFSDGFESWNLGKLSSTDTNTPNPGSTNPWWSPGGGNGIVTGTINGVTPHSGTQMLKGAATGDIDQNVVNLAHRLNSDTPITGNIALDFWFYDANGSGDSHSVGYAELGYYDGVPNNTDYNASHNLAFSTNIQRLILGTTNNTGADLTHYQARVIGGTPTVGTGYGGTAYYINTTTSRSVGWHEGRIVVGPRLDTGGNQVDFYIDDMSTPDASAVTTEDFGYNVLVLNTQLASGTTTINYFDDVTLSSIPEPASLSVLATGALVLAGRRRRAARA